MQVRKTTYKGIEFRSRLEARWAVFFDALGLTWEYEPEGYRLDDGTCYLPDFYVHDIKGHVGREQHGNGIFIEVKGELTDADRNKLNRFQYPIYVVGNLPATADPWVDVTIRFEANPRFMFSEYTVDGTEEDLWFAKKGNQVYLIRWNEAKKNSGLDFCIGARDAALNKKFEYESKNTKTSDTKNFNESGKSPFGNFSKGNSSNPGNSFFDFFTGPYAKSYESPYSRENQRKRGRIDLYTFKAMFLSMPGIKEYHLAERIQFYETEGLPLLCSVVKCYDSDREGIAVGYHYMEQNGESVFVDYFEKRDLLFIPLIGKTKTEKSKDLHRIERPIEVAIKCLKKEMVNYPANAQIRKILDDEENKERELIREVLNRERLAKEDEELYVALNNPHTIGELISAIQEELRNPGCKFTYLEVLAKFELAKGRSAEDKFGVGEYIITRRGEEIIMQMRRTYKGCTPSGRYYNMFDGREFFTLDAKILPSESSFQHAYAIRELTGEFKQLIDLAMERVKSSEEKG